MPYNMRTRSGRGYPPPQIFVQPEINVDLKGLGDAIRDAIIRKPPTAKVNLPELIRTLNEARKAGVENDFIYTILGDAPEEPEPEEPKNSWVYSALKTAGTFAIKLATMALIGYCVGQIGIFLEQNGGLEEITKGYLPESVFSVAGNVVNTTSEFIGNVTSPVAEAYQSTAETVHTSVKTAKVGFGVYVIGKIAKGLGKVYAWSPLPGARVVRNFYR